MLVWYFLKPFTSFIKVRLDVKEQDFPTIKSTLLQQKLKRNLNQYFGVKWDGLNTNFKTNGSPISDEFNKNNVTQLFVGVRIGWRLDSNNY